MKINDVPRVVMENMRIVAAELLSRIRKHYF